MTRDPKLISLALGGGGARGVAHLGVIEELLAHGCRFERIVGVSIGSLAGSLFAFDPDIHRAQERIIEYLTSPGFQKFQRRINASQGVSPEPEEDEGGSPADEDRCETSSNGGSSNERSQNERPESSRAAAPDTTAPDAADRKNAPAGPAGKDEASAPGEMSGASEAPASGGTSGSDGASVSDEPRPSRWARMKRFVRMSVLCQQAVIRASILPGDLLSHAVENLLPDADIADARVPLSIVAVDLLSGQRVVMDRGPLRDAVRGSSSIPGIFPPIEREGQLLCDIGVLNSLPTHAARTDDDTRVVAVDVSSELQPLVRCETAVDVLVRMNNIGESLFRGHMSEVADIVIRPDVGSVEWFNFSDPEGLIQLGRDAARQTLSLDVLPCG